MSEDLQEQLNQIAGELIVARGIIGTLMVQNERMRVENAQLIERVKQLMPKPAEEAADSD